MLTVRNELVQAFERRAFDQFVDELVERAWGYSPRLCKTLSDEELERAVRQTIERAATHGFVQRGAVRFFLETSIALGSEFDSDPQYPWAAETLGSEQFWSPMDKADALHSRVASYVERVQPSARAALEQLHAVANGPRQFERASLAHDLEQLLREVHPEKVKALGDVALSSAVAAGLERAQALGFEQPRAGFVVVALGFAFGHAFERDPFLPWIQRTLQPTNQAERAPARVAERLERRAMIWIEAVLKASERTD
jgi:hypothetical protein